MKYSASTSLIQVGKRVFTSGIMGKHRRFGCKLCAKSYTAKYSLNRHIQASHRQQHNPIPEKVSQQIEASHNIKQNQQQQVRSMTTKPSDDQSNGTEFSLAENTYLRHHLQDIYILQKGKYSIRLHKQELFHIYNMSQAINDSISDFIDGKVIRFAQHLGEDIYLSIHTPYKSVDIRKFWIIPNTNELHPTRIGVPLNFTEYYRFLEVLGKTIFNNAPEDTDIK